MSARWHAANDVGAYSNLDTNDPPVQADTFTPFAPDVTGGVRVAAGDVTGSGRSSLVIASGPGSAPRVSVLDPTTGALVTTFVAGSSTNGVEVAAEKGAVVTGIDSTITRWSSTGGILSSTRTSLPDVRVAAGDVDGDGRQEVIAAGRSTVEILDGTTLAERAVLTPFAGRSLYGVAAGDVDGDGKAEIVVGSGDGRADQVRALRPDGRIVGSIEDVYPGDSGGLRVGAGDFNGDGRAEVVTGPAWGAPDIHLYTLGRTGFFQDPPVGFFAFGSGRCPCPQPDLEGGITMAAFDDGSGTHAFLVTGTGEGQPPAVRTWSSFDGCAAQPEAWHYYGLSDTGAFRLTRARSSTIVPGFFFASDRQPKVPRNLVRWKGNVRDMVASHDPWQLVVSFNEWIEGTSVEQAKEWASRSGFGAYLDVLHNNP